MTHSFFAFLRLLDSSDILSAFFLLPTDISWWSVQSSGTDANLRGVSVVVHHGCTIVWATGAKGTILSSADAGKSWERLHVPEADNSDFRGVQAFGENIAYVMSSGDAGKSHIYKTADAGKSWELQYTDPRKAFFLDALACFDDIHCFALSDPIDGKFLLLLTGDGKHWEELPRDHMPAALPEEGAFAASNSSLFLYGKKEIYFAAGGPAARVFHSSDLGRTWTVIETPILSGKSSQGIFSIARAEDTVVVVGGDYGDPNHSEKTAAYSDDQGKTWRLTAGPLTGFRSAVATYEAGFLAVGPNGAVTSSDGAHWKPIDSPNLNAITFSLGMGWAVGPKGTIARFLDPSN